MAPLIVSWPGGAFPTANTAMKGGARKKTRKASRKQKKRTMKQRRCGYRRTCA
jgi:hypothetical protein